MSFPTLSGLQPSQQLSFQELQETDSKKLNFFAQDGAILPPDEEKKTGDNAQVPDPAPNGGANVGDLKGLCATLSPGAWLAILCVKEASQELEEGTKEILAKSEHIQTKLHEEASNIMKGAVAQLICTVAVSTASIAMSSVSAAKSWKLGGLEGGQLAAAKATPDLLNNISGATNKIGDSVGGLVNSIYQAKNKDVEATIEQARAMEESIKNHMQAQKELASKCLEFYSAMQANMNTTRAKIMG